MTLSLSEYANCDGLGLAELVARRQVTPKELALTAERAIAAINPEVNAVVETYVSYLRRKLGADAVRTVRGVGYRMGKV